jgi:SAM-dependent methyltransferase
MKEPELPAPAAPSEARARFRNLDAYRVDREWDRYEGTAQRRLFRELRSRFLDRHAASAGWVLDLGSGPGRFLPHVGRPGCRRVALDLSVEMLRRIAREGRALPELVRADGVHPPFRAASFEEVVVLGNALGFAGADADRLWQAALELVAPDGSLILEVVAGPGGYARYFRRLPASSLGRLLRAPVRALVPRVDREGFAADPPRREDAGEFRRYSPESLTASLAEWGAKVEEVMAVAPLLGSDREGVEGVAADPTAWGHLLELEEIVGRRVEQIRSAAAVLVAARVSAAPSA